MPSPVPVLPDAGPQADRAPEARPVPPRGMRLALDALGPLALGNANVIMQLARLPVGRGVAESTVDSGRVDKHPVKRLRTTMQFLVIATHGTEAERRGLRHEINKQHRQVRSGPDSEVAYNAFDADLQLWVAACLWRGSEDTLGWLYPDLSEAELDACYRWAERFGTTLQVREGMWPADREAFEEYWQAGLAQVRMDDVTRRYLQRLTVLAGYPKPLQATVGRFFTIMTLGFLPASFREELGLPWTAADQRRFVRITRLLATVNRYTPAPLRQLPMNAYLWDVRRRLRDGRPVV
ncbi:hypothetical protein DSM112329_01481 [Paraconexibacter sp. AEG42_29]|uniref:ER-bound oxygenase mpaB/mpaB'/Rubber oxygenase catalytic domain-containing protein n=1 Tax=Paraconexibacter sp. AEG42_29 TaxID=2997339 RepID=A0AAU7ASS8_9ACTN